MSAAAKSPLLPVTFEARFRFTWTDSESKCLQTHWSFRWGFPKQADSNTNTGPRGSQLVVIITLRWIKEGYRGRTLRCYSSHRTKAVTHSSRRSLIARHRDAVNLFPTCTHIMASVTSEASSCFFYLPQASQSEPEEWGRWLLYYIPAEGGED